MHNFYCDYLSRQFPKYKTNYCLYVNTLIPYIKNNNINVDLMRHLKKKIKLTNIITKKKLNEFLVKTLIEIPREIFVNLQDFDRSLIDSPIHLADGQTISQPSLVGYMIQMLNLTKLKNVANVKILEIGTASGYNAVLLSESLNKLNCRDNTVYSIELLPSLINKAIENISNLYPMESRPVRMEKTNTPQRIVEFDTQLGHLVLYKGDGTQSLGFRYNRIIVTAGGELPLTFLTDLKYKGVLVMPVQLSTQQYIVRFKKIKKSSRKQIYSSSFEALNLILNEMIFQNDKTAIVNFQGLYSLVINIDIPVRFVPLKFMTSVYS